MVAILSFKSLTCLNSLCLDSLLPNPSQRKLYGMDNQDTKSDLDPSDNYDMSGKILVGAIVILLFVVALMMFLHLYARWYLLRTRRRQLLLRARARSARTHLVFHFENDGHHPAANPQLGLDPAVIDSLPVFDYSLGPDRNPVDCAVCLSEFEEGESGRILPKCNHCFHTECIDMWFHSHSTCPLCRAPVEPPVNPAPIEPGSSREVPHSRHRKPTGPVGITVDVPSRRFNSGIDDDSGAGSTPTQFRSPLGRMLSFRRILSRERRPASPSPSTSYAIVAGSQADVDLEKGKSDTDP